MSCLIKCCWLLLIVITWQNVNAGEADEDAHVVGQTDKGPIRGRIEEIGDKVCNVFLGVPYAQPPVGKLRFKNALPIKKSWKKVRDASQFSASCPQTFLVPEVYERLDKSTPEGKESEDCLYLNIYTPAMDTKARLPVLVWIHGGGCVMGSGALWRGEHLSTRENIVVVTLNYRLGLLGYLTARDNNNEEILPSNNGHLDQRLALQWIQKNIHNFGGDPSRVTIGGNSAGALHVGFHMLSPASRGLFHGAILQSGSPMLHLCYHKDFQDTNVIMARILNSTQCNKSRNNDKIMQCLQKIPVDQIIETQWSEIHIKAGPFKPIVDGNIMPADPKELLDQGKINKVNVIFGITQGDGSLFNMLLPNIDKGVIRPFYQTIIQHQFSHLSTPLRTVIEHRYTDHSNSDDPFIIRTQLKELWDDFYFIAPAVYCGDKFATHGLPTYMYLFSQRTANSYYYPDHAGTGHQMEVSYLFGFPIKKPEYFKDEFDEKDVYVSNDMMTMWGSFIKSGKPIGPVKWPRYEPGSRYYLNVSVQPQIHQHYRQDDAEFWNDVVPAVESQFQQMQDDIVSGQGQQGKGNADIYKTSTLVLLGCVVYLVFNVISSASYKQKKH